MTRDLVTALIQLAISLGGSALLIKLLTLRQEKRKINSEGQVGEANAASMLSGAALTIVQNADARAESAYAETERLWTALNKLRWKAFFSDERVQLLESKLRDAGLAVPPPGPSETDLPSTPPPRPVVSDDDLGLT